MKQKTHKLCAGRSGYSPSSNHCRSSAVSRTASTRTQLLTIEALLTGDEELAMPREYGTFRRAPRAKQPTDVQHEMHME